jgi:hypothetical protein
MICICYVYVLVASCINIQYNKYIYNIYIWLYNYICICLYNYIILFMYCVIITTFKAKWPNGQPWISGPKLCQGDCAVSKSQSLDGLDGLDGKSANPMGFLVVSTSIFKCSYRKITMENDHFWWLNQLYMAIPMKLDSYETLEIMGYTLW